MSIVLNEYIQSDTMHTTLFRYSFIQYEPLDHQRYLTKINSISLMVNQKFYDLPIMKYNEQGSLCVTSMWPKYKIAYSFLSGKDPIKICWMRPPPAEHCLRVNYEFVLEDMCNWEKEGF